MTNKTCDRCGREIPNSENRSMSDIDAYWCDECEQSESESIEELEQRLADRDALGVEPRPDNPLASVVADPLDQYRAAMSCAQGRIEKLEHPYTYERVGTEHGIAWRLTWWTPNLTAEEAQRHLNFAGDPDEAVSWDEALADINGEDDPTGTT